MGTNLWSEILVNNNRTCGVTRCFQLILFFHRLFILLEADLDNKFTLITNEYMDGYNARHDCHISLVTLLPDLIGLFRGQKVKRILVRKQYL